MENKIKDIFNFLTGKLVISHGKTGQKKHN